MDFRKVAGDIVGGINDEKWQQTQSKIQDALDSAYRLGFLDGEASIVQYVDALPKTDLQARPDDDIEDAEIAGVGV